MQQSASRGPPRGRRWRWAWFSRKRATTLGRVLRGHALGSSARGCVRRNSVAPAWSRRWPGRVFGVARPSPSSLRASTSPAKSGRGERGGTARAEMVGKRFAKCARTPGSSARGYACVEERIPGVSPGYGEAVARGCSSSSRPRCRRRAWSAACWGCTCSEPTLRNGPHLAALIPPALTPQDSRPRTHANVLRPATIRQYSLV
jgi:hypothetical protein